VHMVDQPVDSRAPHAALALQHIGRLTRETRLQGVTAIEPELVDRELDDRRLTGPGVAEQAKNLLALSVIPEPFA